MTSIRKLLWLVLLVPCLAISACGDNGNSQDGGNGDGESGSDPTAATNGDGNGNSESPDGTTPTQPACDFPCEEDPCDPCKNQFCEPIPNCDPNPTTTTTVDLTPLDLGCVDDLSDRPVRVPQQAPTLSFAPSTVSRSDRTPTQTSAYYEVEFKMPNDWIEPVAESWALSDALGLLFRASPDNDVALFLLRYGQRMEGASGTLNQLTARRWGAAEIDVLTLDPGARLTDRSALIFEFQATLKTPPCQRVNGITVVYPRGEDNYIVLTALARESAGDEGIETIQKIVSSLKDFNIAPLTTGEG